MLQVPSMSVYSGSLYFFFFPIYLTVLHMKFSDAWVWMGWTVQKIPC
jgi:hypothetical protein